MSINDFAEKIKPLYFLILFAVVAAIFFALGRLSAIEERHQPVKILQPVSDQTANAISAIGTTENATSAQESSLGVGGTQQSPSAVSGVSPQTASGGQVIGSKTGKKYYFPWCGTVKRIKPENQVTFATVDLAKAAGYTPGGNCKGLQ